MFCPFLLSYSIVDIEVAVTTIGLCVLAIAYHYWRIVRRYRALAALNPPNVEQIQTSEEEEIFESRQMEKPHVDACNGATGGDSKNFNGKKNSDNRRDEKVSDEKLSPNSASR